MAKNRFLFWIVAVAVVFRLGAVFIFGDTVDILPGIYDQVSYHNLAIRLLGGHGFTFDQEWWPITKAGAPTAHWSYLYTLFITAVYAIFGIHPIAVRLIQAVISGVAMPWLVFRLCQAVFPRLVVIHFGKFRSLRFELAYLAAAWMAVYAYLIYYSGALMTESFYIIGILLILDCGLRIRNVLLETGKRRFPYRLFIELGVISALTAMLRQVFLVFLPFLFLWFVWVTMDRQKFWKAVGKIAKGGVISLGVFIILVAPITAWNYHQFNRFVLLNTNAGYAFFWANHPIYGDHFMSILPASMGTYQDLIPQELRWMDEAQLDQALLQRGLGFVTADPWRYIKLSISRIPEYFLFWPKAESGTLSNIVRVGSFGLALPFILLGICFWITELVKKMRGKNRNRKKHILASSAQVFLVFIFIVVYSGIHILSWALIRYRLPVDAVCLPIAAYGLVRLLSIFRFMDMTEINPQQVQTSS